MHEVLALMDPPYEELIRPDAEHRTVEGDHDVNLLQLMHELGDECCQADVDARPDMPQIIRRLAASST